MLAPKTQPSRRLLAANSVLISVQANCRFRKTIAPLIIAVSNPKSRPPSAATTAMR